MTTKAPTTAQVAADFQPSAAGLSWEMVTARATMSVTANASLPYCLVSLL